MKKMGFGLGVIFLAAAIVLGALMQAYSTAARFPKELVFGDQILDPICVDVVGEQHDYPHQIEPLACRTDEFVYNETLPRVPDQNTHAVKVDYQDSEASMGDSGAFVAYKYIGTIDEGHVLSVSSSGGGSGIFSGIRVVRRAGDTLEIVEDLGGGDRCNGGVADVDVTRAGQVLYQLNATPYDLASVGISGEAPFNAYDDLPACALCCGGVVELMDGVPVAIEFNPSVASMVSEPDRPIFTCYNNMVKSYLKAGKARLDMDTARQFSAEFVASCLPKSPAAGE